MFAREALAPPSVMVATALALAACTGPTEPRKVAPSLVVVSGRSATDTIGAQLAVPLTVIVRDSTGAPADSSPVTFTVLQAPGTTDPSYMATVVAPTSYVYAFGPQTAMKEWTDSTGRTAVTVRLGTVAGQIRIAIDGNALPVHDTITYSVLPGAAVRLDVQPSDTALYVGSRYQLRVRSLDRAGNERPDSVSLAGGDSVLTLDGQRGASGRRYGRDFTDVATATHRARVWVSVVPTGTLAVTFSGYATDYGVGVINLDGSGRRRLFGPGAYPGTAHSPRWSVDGKWIAAVQGGKVYLVDAKTGSGRMVTLDSPDGTETSPAFSPDGRWIYFSMAPYATNQYTLWRVSVDSGSRAEQIPIPMQYTPHQVDLSPDGTRMVYVAGDGYLHELALADGSERAITPAHGLLNAPRYSPDGGAIAYALTGNYPAFDPDDGVYTIPVGSSTAQRITPPISGYPIPEWSVNGGNAWSIDGEWIVSASLYRLYVINVTTGLVLPLPWSDHDYADPAWKPR